MIDVPWNNLNPVWNAQELENATKMQRNWNDTLQHIQTYQYTIVHDDIQTKPQIATFESATDDQLLPLLALGGK